MATDFNSARFLSALISCVLCLSLGSDAAATEQMRLTVGKEVYEVPIGEPFAVAIGGKRITMKLEKQDSLEFSESGVSFAYPSLLKLEKSEEDNAVEIWTFQGQSAAIMLQRYETKITPDSLSEALLANILDQYTKKDVKRLKVKLRGKDRSIEGVQLQTFAKGVTVLQNLFTFANEEGVFALMVQDARSEKGKESEEYQASLRLLGETLEVGEEPELPKDVIIEETENDDKKEAADTDEKE